MEKQTSDHIFDLFFENSIDLLCIADKSGNFVKLNNAWTDTLGYQLTELEGRPYIEFVHPEDVESTIQATIQLANNQKVQHFINRYKHKNGKYRWIEWLSYPSEDTVYASAHDITDRIEAEQALKESESKYRKIVEDLPLALCVADMGGNITYINNTFIKYFGYELAEIPTIEKWALLVFASEEKNKTSAAFWHQNIEEITQTEALNILPRIYSVRTKSGKNIETEITLVIIGSELYIFFNDVTEKQKAEEALQKRVLALTKPLDDAEAIKFTDLFNIEELQKVQDTFSDATGVASIITHTDGTPITRPSNFCTLCNLIRGTEKGRTNCFKSDKIIGKQNIDGPIVQPCYSGGLWDAGAGITLGGKHFANWLIGQVRNEVQDEKEMLKYADKIGVDREQFRQALKEVPMMSKERFEKVSQALFVLANQLSLKAYQNVQQARFIAEQNKAESQIKKLNTELEKRVLDRTEQLQQANKDLEAFAYSISHDLRAPLRHIDGFVNLLYSNIHEPGNNVTNYYKKISTATKRLSVMIEELLAFSRLGRKEISYSHVNLQLLVSNVIENLKPEFAHRKIKWIIGNLPVVYGDLSLLQFAFENIISNSIKYTGKKELAIIELGTLSKKENETGLLTVFIKDNGAGFDMKYADKLFGVFQRLHTNEEFEGIGIGLANVKQIVTKHKGSISFESEVDQGATFYITLPEPSENI